jgi:hypothetical protein
VPAGHGVDVAGLQIPSASSADDIALAAASLPMLETLVTAYLCWCDLLSITAMKMQALGPGHAVRVEPLTTTAAATFRFVGVEFGPAERATTVAHLPPPLAKATEMAQRRRALTLPVPLDLASLPGPVVCTAAPHHGRRQEHAAHS